MSQPTFGETFGECQMLIPNFSEPKGSESSLAVFEIEDESSDYCEEIDFFANSTSSNQTVSNGFPSNSLYRSLPNKSLIPNLLHETSTSKSTSPTEKGKNESLRRSSRSALPVSYELFNPSKSKSGRSSKKRKSSPLNSPPEKKQKLDTSPPLAPTLLKPKIEKKDSPSDPSLRPIESSDDCRIQDFYRPKPTIKKIKQEKKEKSKAVTWIDEAIGTDKGRTYYMSMVLDSMYYTIGDACYFFAPTYYVREYYLGRIMSLFEENGEKMVEVAWYFTQEEMRITDEQKLNLDLKHEVFLSDPIDVNPVDTICGKIQILTFDEFEELKKKGSSLDHIYFCRSFYNWHFNVLDLIEIPLLYFHIYKKESRSVPEKRVFLTALQLNYIQMEIIKYRTGDRTKPVNWPPNIKYSNQLDLEPLNTPYHSIICQGNSSSIYEIRTITKKDHPAFGQRGLFAKSEIEKDIIIGEYTGKVLKRRKNQKCGQYTCILYQDDEVMIDVDAEEYGNEIRFINDYRDITAHPNVKYEKAFWNGSWRVIVKTIKKIKSEEEILVDYGPTYWDE